MTDFRCPGASYSIERAVHLGRLNSSYPPCRSCRHRDDLAGLSPRQARRVRDFLRHLPPPRLARAGFAGIWPNQIDAAYIGRLGQALGRQLRAGDDAAGVLVAHDRRPLMVPLLAALHRGLRWAGCDVLDGGPSTFAAMQWALRAAEPPPKALETTAEPRPIQRAVAGVLVGRADAHSHHVALRLFDAHGELWPPTALVELEGQLTATFPRPTRTFGGLAATPIEPDYFAALAPFYHALRPLRYAICSTSRPLIDLLVKLNSLVAVQALVVATADEVRRAAAAERIDFGVVAEDDGRRWQIIDDLGRTLPPDALSTLWADDESGQESQLAPECQTPLPHDVATAVTQLLRRLSRDDRPLSATC